MGKNMIERLTVTNFKCFGRQSFRFAPLTLLCGVNSGGKSSVIQSILLASEVANVEKKEGIIDLMHLKFGIPLYSFQEIQYEDAEEDKIVIEVESNGNNVIVCLDSQDVDNNVRYVRRGEGVRALMPVWYLGSERSINRIQEKGNPMELKLGEGNRYLAYLLSLGRERKIPVYAERSRGTDEGYFSEQVNQWLNYLIPGNNVYGLPSGEDNLMTLKFGRSGNRFHKSNVGFGISFVLPIIVAGLLAEKGDILIVENPELHLHPKAQSNLMCFFATVAASGVQVIIETHSDHIVNGMKKTIIDPDYKLGNDDGKIFFFGSDKSPQIIDFNEKAEFSKWPDGFLDQTEIDLYSIRKMRI